MEDISGYGYQVNIIASKTFPVGIVVNAFSDDSDPFDIPSVQIAETAMGVNGDLIGWSRANPIKVTVSVIPNSPDDILLGILLEANRVGRGKVGAKDIITMSGVYPDGRALMLINGMITDGMPGNSLAGTGRQKTKVYMFSFENKIGV